MSKDWGRTYTLNILLTKERKRGRFLVLTNPLESAGIRGMARKLRVQYESAVSHVGSGVAATTRRTSSATRKTVRVKGSVRQSTIWFDASVELG